jgi:S-adenosylmethionine hydrolase
VVREGCTAFPTGTVHIIDVASQQPFLCIKAHGQYYLCCDNGLPSMVFADAVEDCVRLAVHEGGVYNFAAYSVFAPAAAHLLRGADMHSLGEPFPQLVPRTMPRFIQQGDYYRIYIHYIDNYGNAYLGMTYREFEELRQERPFVLTVRDQDVTEIMTGYYQQHAKIDPRRRLRLTVSATGLLELAVKESSLAQLLGLRVSESVLLRFK